MDEEFAETHRGVSPKHLTPAHALVLVVCSSLGAAILTFALVGNERNAAGATHVAPLAEQAAIDAREARIISLVERASNAVVSVVVTKDVPTYEQYYEEIDPFGGWGGFGGFQVPRLRERGTERREVGGGTGFFVSPEGLVVTNRHVVSDTTADYSILLNDGTSRTATVLARDPVLDIAVLKVNGSVPAHLTLGNSETLRPGQTVVAIGNALGEFRNSVSVGVVSGLARSIVAGDALGTSETLEDVIQTDAAINPGNSGGPLLNLSGEVIGVNVAVADNAENIGFAIPASMLRGVVESVKTYGEIRRAYMGVRYVTVTPELSDTLGLPVRYGALIDGGNARTALADDSPAVRAGLAEGDVLVAIDDTSLEEVSLAAVLRTKQPGEVITVTYYRGTKRETTEVTLAQMPERR